jgi:hypothetical protein
VADLVWEANTGCRPLIAVWELLADSEPLARETLLDANRRRRW